MNTDQPHFPGQRTLFWDGSSLTPTHETATPSAMWEFLKHYGGDKTKWRVATNSNQGWLDLPIPTYLL